jgi:hypothetical protein
VVGAATRPVGSGTIHVALIDVFRLTEGTVETFCA